MVFFCVQDSGSGSLEGGPHFLDRGGGGFKRKEKRKEKAGGDGEGRGRKKSGRKKRKGTKRKEETKGIRKRKRKRKKGKRKTEKGPHRGFFSWVGRRLFLFSPFFYSYFLCKKPNLPLPPEEPTKRRFAAGGHISEGGPSKQHEG